MHKKTHVLVFPAGEINSVELHNALSACVNIKLFGASSVDRHGEFIFQNYIPSLPFINDPGFIKCLNAIISEHEIDVIFPTHDDIAEFLAENRKRIDAVIITADVETARICRDKAKTYELFSGCDFCPKLYTDAKEFPLFIKPRRGQGSVGAKRIKEYADLPADTEGYVLCEYLPGEELTVDCFTDKNGVLQAILPRSRERIFGGVSVRSGTVPLTNEIERIASVINARLKFLGLWYFQIKRDSNGAFKLLEISTRCAGTMCLSRVLGVNLPLLSVYAALGRDTLILKNTFAATVDRTLVSRYKTDLTYNRVYIDLDDTIIVDNKVHLQAIRFLYQCLNMGKRIYLITRHHASHYESAADALRRYKIPAALYEAIIELDAGQQKADFMEPAGAIFIDNAFAERQAVFSRHGIPVFDVDGIEFLLDWRS